MKKLLILLLILFPSISSAITSVSDLNPISHWKCDETSTGVRYDSNIVNSNDLTDNNSVASAVGILNNACDFESSSSQYLSITDANQQSLDFTGSMSVSAWVKLESALSNYSYRVILAKDNVTYRSYSYQLWDSETPAGTFNQLFQMYNSVGTVNQFNIGWAPSTATWYHIGYAYDATAHKTFFYVNGTSTGSEDLSNVDIRDTSAPFSIGAYGHGVGFWDGLIDEISVFNTKLSASDFSALYNNGTPLPYSAVSTTTSSSTTSTSTSTFEDENILFMLAVIIFFLASLWFGHIMGLFRKV